jgi:hypothetical protein
MNNVALSAKILIQVHKPGRVDKKEFDEAMTENIERYSNIQLSKQSENS